MGVHVGPQDVRQHQCIAGIGLAPSATMAVSISRGRQRIDRQDRPAAGDQRCDQQALGGLDRHRHLTSGARPELGERLQELAEALYVVADSQLCDHGAVVVDDRNIVVIVGPVDPAEHALTLSFNRWEPGIPAP